MIAAGGLVHRVVRRVAFALLVCATAALVGLATGCAVGRWRVAAVAQHGRDVHIASSDGVFGAPVPYDALAPGDVVVAQLPHRHRPSLLRISSFVDQNHRHIAVVDAHGNAQQLWLPHTVWRVQKRIPVLGLLLRSIVGPIQCLLLAIVGVALILYGEWSRHPRTTLRRKAIPPIEHV